MVTTFRSMKKVHGQTFDISFRPERASQKDIVTWVRQGGRDFLVSLLEVHNEQLVISHGIGQTELKRPSPLPKSLLRERVEDFRETRQENTVSGDRRFFRPVLLWWLMVSQDKDPEQLVCQEAPFSALPPVEHPMVDHVRQAHHAVLRDPALNDGTEDNEADMILDWRNERLSMSERLIRDWCVCMEESLPMRDAVLISSVSGMSYPDLLDVGCNPTDPTVRKKEDSQLQTVFLDTAWEKKYGGTTLLAIDALIGIIRHVDGQMAAQPCAMLAYLLWWAGRGEESLAAALRALCDDKTCSLAKLVVKVCRRHVQPAWLEKKNEERKVTVE
jgi:hypothetical protein